MMRRWIRRLLAALTFVALTLSCVPSTAQGPANGLQGTVTDMATGAPIAGAEIRAGDHVTRTDRHGRYTLALPPGMHDVRSEADGYIGMTHTKQQLGVDSSTELDFEMIPRDPTPEQDTIIVARLLQPPVEAHAMVVEIEEVVASQVGTVPSAIRVKMLDGTIVTMTMDEYLKGVVPYEMSPSWPMEALKAQAVAARSYAATNRKHAAEGYDVCTTTHCQFWGPTHYDTTDAAVEATHGIAAFHNGAIIYAFYHGHCDGRTRSYKEVWGRGTVDIAYLQSVECPCGYDQLWGHGVGMCQQGARALARDQGKTFEEILEHYYTGVTVQGPTPNVITAAHVSPTSGTDLTEFVFTASYDGPSPVLPAVANVVINGRAYAMERLPSAAGSGYHYQLVTSLPLGSHHHYFYFDDGYGNASRAPASGTYAGPNVSASATGAPPPTPVPALSNMARSHSITTGTVTDWSLGTRSGLAISDVGDGALVLAPGSDRGTYVSPVLTLPAACDALALTWVAQDPPEIAWLQPQPIAMEIRTRAPNGAWSAWRTIAPSDSNGGRAKLRMSDLHFGAFSEVQFAATLAKTSLAAPILEQVRVIGLVISDDASAAKVTPLGIVPREAWGADEALRSVEPIYRTPRIVILHHTGAPTAGIAYARAMRGLYYYDAVVREVGDLGVHYVIAADGTIYEGRYGGLGNIGQHAAQYDYHSIAIALLGTLDSETPSAAMLTSLTDLLARLGSSLEIPATERRQFQNVTLPSIAGLNELYSRQPPRSPGANVIARLPEIRSTVLAKMDKLPIDGARLGGIVPLEIEASQGITEIEYAVDGTARHVATQAPYRWHWQTGSENEGAKTLRVTIRTDDGDTVVTRSVQVDNPPPTGVGVLTPPWTNQRSVMLETGDAANVQFSHNWVWEGEQLYHTPNSGAPVSDADALNGQAWRATPPTHGAGDWFGPYSCELPAWGCYVVSFRMRQTAPATGEPLALIKVQDTQGRRIYAQCTVTPDMLPTDGSYTEITLNLPYQAVRPTCADPDLSDGIEFYVHYRGTGGLALDRVTVWTAPRPIAAIVPDVLPERDGLHTFSVRFTDEAGNASDHAVSVGLDRTPPKWLSIGDRSSVVQDTLSGIDTSQVMWSASADGGQTWGPWHPLALAAAPGATDPLTLAAPAEAGPLVRFAVQDLAGNRTVDKHERALALPLITRNATWP